MPSVFLPGWHRRSLAAGVSARWWPGLLFDDGGNDVDVPFRRLRAELLFLLEIVVPGALERTVPALIASGCFSYRLLRGLCLRRLFFDGVAFVRSFPGGGRGVHLECAKGTGRNRFGGIFRDLDFVAALNQGCAMLPGGGRSRHWRALRRLGGCGETGGGRFDLWMGDVR